MNKGCFFWQNHVSRGRSKKIVRDEGVGMSCKGRAAERSRVYLNKKWSPDLLIPKTGMSNTNYGQCENGTILFARRDCFGHVRRSLATHNSQELLREPENGIQEEDQR